MKIWTKLELEVKIIVFAVIFFAVFGVFFSNIYEKEIDTIISKGINRNLTAFLQEKLAQNPDENETNEILMRQMQWEVSAPFIARTQKNNVRNMLLFFTITLIFVAAVLLICLTYPLKKLAKSVEKIGKGEYVKIEANSGGALGRFELQVAKMQDELLILREKEQIAATEKAWKDIAKVMAHEIKNPLTPMRLLIDKMEEKTAAEADPAGAGSKATKISVAEMKKFTERMNRQLNALEVLVNKFRSFSKAQEAVCSQQNLFSAISETADDFQNEITSKIDGSKDTSAFFDKNFLSQILLNIYKNSVNAGAKNMAVSICESSNFVEITLADDGKGLAKEKLDRVFLPYVSFSDGGSGIGLSVVKNLCEKMGGECFVKSEQNNGFTITLKLKRSA